jgi:hypothetical protein
MSLWADESITSYKKYLGVAFFPELTDELYTSHLSKTAPSSSILKFWTFSSRGLMLYLSTCNPFCRLEQPVNGRAQYGHCVGRLRASRLGLVLGTATVSFENLLTSLQYQAAVKYSLVLILFLLLLLFSTLLCFVIVFVYVFDSVFAFLFLYNWCLDCCVHT